MCPAPYSVLPQIALSSRLIYTSYKGLNLANQNSGKLGVFGPTLLVSIYILEEMKR